MLNIKSLIGKLTRQLINIEVRNVLKMMYGVIAMKVCVFTKVCQKHQSLFQSQSYIGKRCLI
jgi:hypothetical protein